MQAKDGRGFGPWEDFFEELCPFREVTLEAPKRKFYPLVPSYFDHLWNTTLRLGHQHSSQVVTSISLKSYCIGFLGFF